EILEYFRYLKINDNINLDEIIDLIEMLCFDVEIKKKILTPFLKEYKNKQLLKYFDEFDIYLFPHDQLKHFLTYLSLTHVGEHKKHIIRLLKKYYKDYDPHVDGHNYFTIMKYFEQNINMIKYFMKHTGHNMKYVSNELKNNFELAKFACSRSGDAMKYVSNELKNNLELIKISCSENGNLIEYVSDELKNNLELAKLACSRNGLAIQYVSDELKNNLELAKIACSQNGLAIQYVSDELKNNLELAKIA